MKYHSILIDLDDTLIVEEESAYQSFLSSANYLNKLYNVDIKNFINTVKKEARELWYSLPTINYASAIGISSWEALWAEFTDIDENQSELKRQKKDYHINSWHNALLRFNINDKKLAAVLAGIYKKTRKNKHILFDDTKYFLNRVIETGRKICLITNGTPDLQRQKINKSGLSKIIKNIIISGEIGYKKPLKEIFEISLNKINAQPENSLMIGDNLESDIKGANEMGITSVWLNRTKKENNTDIKPKFEFYNLTDILNII